MESCSNPAPAESECYGAKNNNTTVSQMSETFTLMLWNENNVGDKYDAPPVTLYCRGFHSTYTVPAPAPPVNDNSSM